MPLLSPEQTARLTLLNQIVVRNEGTPEEIKAAATEGVRIMRQGRVAAQAASTTKKTQAAVDRAPANTAGALADLRALGASLESKVIG